MQLAKQAWIDYMQSRRENAWGSCYRWFQPSESRTESVTNE